MCLCLSMCASSRSSLVVCVVGVFGKVLENVCSKCI